MPPYLSNKQTWKVYVLCKPKLEGVGSVTLYSDAWLLEAHLSYLEKDQSQIGIRRKTKLNQNQIKSKRFQFSISWYRRCQFTRANI